MQNKNRWVLGTVGDRPDKVVRYHIIQSRTYSRVVLHSLCKNSPLVSPCKVAIWLFYKQQFTEQLMHSVFLGCHIYRVNIKPLFRQNRKCQIKWFVVKQSITMKKLWKKNAVWSWEMFSMWLFMLALRGHYHSVQHQHVLSEAFKPSSDPDNTATKSQQHLHFSNTHFQKLFSVKDILTAEHTHTHTHTHTHMYTHQCKWITLKSHSDYQELPFKMSYKSSLM